MLPRKAKAASPLRMSRPARKMAIVCLVRISQHTQVTVVMPLHATLLLTVQKCCTRNQLVSKSMTAFWHFPGPAVPSVCTRGDISEMRLPLSSTIQTYQSPSRALPACRI